MVDLKAFADLSGDTLHELQHSGALLLVCSHIVSLANLEDGLLAKKASGRIAPEPAPGLVGFDDGGTLQFDWSRLH